MTAAVADWYRCTRCSRPVSPWESTVCVRCRDKAEADALRQWAEDNQ